jgi:hypothetical protein
MPDTPSESHSTRVGPTCPQREVWTGRILFLWAGLLLTLVLPACRPTPAGRLPTDTPISELPTSLSPTLPPATLPPATLPPATLPPATLPPPEPTPTLTATPTAAPTATPVETSPAIEPISPENAAEIELIDQARGFTAQAAGWLPGSDSLALANEDGIQILILTDDQEEQVTQGPTLPTTLSISPTSGRMAIARPDNRIDLFDPAAAGEPAAGMPAATLPGHTGTITSLTFSADGRWLASAATDNTVRIWEAESGVFLAGWQLEVWVTDLAFSPDGTRLAGVDLGAFTIHIWGLSRLALDTPGPLDRPLGAPPVEQTLNWEPEAIPALYQVEFAPDWGLVAWVARGTVQLMQVATGELGPTCEHEDYVNGVAWSPDGSLLASAAAAMVEDQFHPATLLWDPLGGKLINTLILPAPVSGVYFSPDGNMLAILGAEGEVQLWAAPR